MSSVRALKAKHLLQFMVERSGQNCTSLYETSIVGSRFEIRSSSRKHQWRYLQEDSLRSNPQKSDTSTTSSDNGKHGQELVLYNSLSKTYQRIGLPTDATLKKGLAWYTCGPTTYAPAHLGHARTYVWIDILRRILEFVTERRNGIPPLFVMNVTDVDDKILAAAKESPTGESPLQLARRYEAEFWRDMDALGCLRPHVVTRVTEHVESAIVPYIQKLESNGVAYLVQGVGVYFDVKAFDAKVGRLTKYGKLAPPTAAIDFFDNHPPRDSAEESTSTADKRDARDFALWKCRKEDEELYWESPWGQGRPGWHIECSAMIEAVQQRFQYSHVFQVHAGGIDLKFPHHTNEIAQAEAYLHADDRWTGEWISRWVHTGHVHIDGLKMSKSLKNFITIEELLHKDEGLSTPLVAPADDFRLWCLGMSGSYRGPATFSYDRIHDACVVRQKVVRFLLDGGEWLRNAGEGTVKSWRSLDVDFLRNANEASSKCLRSLLGSYQESSSFDVDGATFVEELLEIAEAGGEYLRKANYDETPVEPLIAVLSTTRKLLSLVGFTDATSRAGLDVASTGGQQQVVGGERALVDEFVRFRALVRQAALNCSVDSDVSELKGQILAYSDDVRKIRLPTIGVEVMDPKAGSVGSGSEDDAASSPLVWRFCLPRSPDEESTSKSKQESKATHAPPTEWTEIPVEDLFRVGQYEGQFSEFTSDGIPTRNADGTEMSKSLLKKLMKKRVKHQERLLYFVKK